MIEVKLSNSKYKQDIDSNRGQDRWLISSEVIDEVQRLYGAKHVTKTVLYAGATDDAPDERGVRWVNVEDWLLNKVDV